MDNKLRMASFFAGVGGIDLGFEQSKGFKTVYANEFDPYPVKTFELNFDIKVDCRDINEVKSSEVPDVDIVCGGFPCQAFSIAGYRKGFDDDKGRGILFFEMLRIIRDKKPRVVFFENVKNLVSHDKGNTFQVIIDALKREGYFLKHDILNAMECGNVPQNRERIYIVGFLSEEEARKFSFPKPIPLKKKISDIIDFKNEINEKYYYTKGKYKGDIYEKLDEAMDDENTVYQWRRQYVRKNMSGVVPTLTANMGEGGHNVPLVRTKYGIRKLTPHECFNAQGFPDDFILPKDMAESRLYKQAGNSVCVGVIRRIAENILVAMGLTV
ncbi:MAG: DNA cytosine methyltransferase [Firmicutes bacterium]|nr:DNA cytosine methyltransferase [Bacillota bacterium]